MARCEQILERMEQFAFLRKAMLIEDLVVISCGYSDPQELNLSQKEIKIVRDRINKIIKHISDGDIKGSVRTILVKFRNKLI